MEQKIKENKNNNKIGLKDNLIQKNSPLKLKAIKNLVNDSKQIDLKRNIFNKKQNLINIQLVKYMNINNKKRNETNEEDKKEDITDYINTDNKEIDNSYKIMNNEKVANEAIEEVEEAKEMSALNQSSEIISPSPKESQSQSIIKKNISSKNKIIKKENEYYLDYKKNDLKNKCTKISLNKKNISFNISLPVKTSDISLNKFVNNNRHLNIEKINNKNNGNKLITKYYNNLTELPTSSNIKYIYINQKPPNTNKNKEKPKYNKMFINKRIKNNRIIRKKNMENKNMKRSRENLDILKTYNDLENNSKYKKSSRTTTNLKNNIINNKIFRSENNYEKNNKSKIDLSYIKGKKLGEKKPLFENVFKYNKQLKKLNIGSNKRSGKSSKSEFSKSNNLNKKIIYKKKGTKSKRTEELNFNLSYTFVSFNKIQLRINKLKNSEEKYHKLFEDYYSRYQKNKNREMIKKALIDKQK